MPGTSGASDSGLSDSERFSFLPHLPKQFLPLPKLPIRSDNFLSDNNVPSESLEYCVVLQQDTKVSLGSLVRVIAEQIHRAMEALQEDEAVESAILQAVARYADQVEVPEVQKLLAGQTSGFVLLRNLPVFQESDAGENEFLNRILLALLASQQGRLYAFEGQRNNAVIQLLTPVFAERSMQTGANSEELYWHTEDASVKFNSDLICLLCMRSDPRALTFVSMPRLSQLDEATLLELEKPQFHIYADESYLSVQHKHGCPVLEREGESLRIRFDPIYTHCSSESGWKALHKLYEEVNRSARSICLEDGELLFMDNRLIVHGRSSYEPRYDGTDRKLLRTAVLSRPVPREALFKPNVIKTSC